MMSAACKAWATRMSSSRITLHPAWVLHSRPYRDSSLLIDLFTESHGRIAAIAKGAKQAKSKFNGLLQPFSQLLISWSGRGELVTLTDADMTNSNQQQAVLALKGKSLLAGFYLNELLLRLTERHDPHPELFQAYQHTLRQLISDQHIEITLRKFECYLLQEIGYGLILEHDVESGQAVQLDQHYCYYPERGPVRIQEQDQDQQQHTNPLVLQGRTLLALQQGELDDRVILQEAKRFMRAIIDHQLGGRPIKTRELKLHKIL